MKSIKILSICLAVILGLSSCASSWLDQELTGSTLTQEEYNKMNNVAVGTVKGLYAQLYMYGNCGSGHDAFGQKTIDLVSDLTSSDMAMCAEAYGWFVTDAHRQLSSRSAYYWSYFYGIVMNANAVLRSLDHKASLTTEEKESYAQALSMRAFCYYQIANLYGPTDNDVSQKSQYGRHGVAADYDLAPIYTQNDTTETGLIKEQPLSTLKQVREFVRKDLADAIELFDETGFARTSKLYIDGDVARALQAYNFLQMAWIMTDEDEYNTNKCYQEAYNHAMDVIDGGRYSMLKYEDVLTTGFVNVQDKSWMWGLDVTAENYTGLASFWGHVDVHTYSYAFAGATKGCDQNLYDAITDEDIRKQWFDPTRKNIPDWKFYDLNRGVTADEIDRDWKNDIVYMRIEEMYLIAAEAAYRSGDMARAKSLLSELLAERLSITPEEYLANAYGGNTLMQLYMNWRIELWGEGRSLITWKRFAPGGSDYSSKYRGSNHYTASTEEMKAYDWNYVVYIMPASEDKYNNEIND